MTREEREDAIDIIQSILDKYEEDECLVTEITIGDEDIKAFKMAIEALENDPKIVPIAEIKYDEDKLKELVNKTVLTVTPQPRKGHWISTETKGVRYAFWCRYKCSLCGELSDYTNFCPNCGADMREVEE